MNINEYNYNMESIDLLPDVANVCGEHALPH